MINYEDFDKVDIRAGKIVEVEEFPRARKPSYKIRIDLGEEVGLKWSSVAAKSEYTIDEMMGRYVVCVVNFPPKNIAGFMSEVLTLGVPAIDGSLSLLQPSKEPRIGGRVY